MSLLIAVMGTTASGKTELAEALADELGAQLVNNDAFQIYRGMDVGTAKSPRKAEYRLMDIRDPDESFGVGEWVSLAQEALTGPGPFVVVGGTGLYVRAFFEDYSDMAPPPDPSLREELNGVSLEVTQRRLLEADPQTYARVDLKNPVRVQRALERALMKPGTPARLHPATTGFGKAKFWLQRDPLETEARIANRAAQMVASGWIEEVESLRRNGFSRDDPGMRAHGYRHIWDVLEGKIEIAQALELTTNEVRRYAKRQRTWLRKEPGVIPIEGDDALQQALREIELFRE